MMTKEDHMRILEQQILEEEQVTGFWLSYVCSLWHGFHCGCQQEANWFHGQAKLFERNFLLDGQTRRQSCHQSWSICPVHCHLMKPLTVTRLTCSY